MAYSTQTDVQIAAGGADRLTQLADPNSIGAVDSATVDAAIARADGWIDMHINERYAVPLVTVPEAIRRISSEEAVFRLQQDRQMVDEVAMRLHDERQALLEAIADGRKKLGIEPPPPKSSAVAATVLDPDDLGDGRSRNDWKGFA